MFDGDTAKFWCDRTGLSDPSNENFTIPGMIISPNHGQLTIAKGIRFYPMLIKTMIRRHTFSKAVSTVPYPGLSSPKVNSQVLLKVFQGTTKLELSTLRMKVVILFVHSHLLIIIPMVMHTLSIDYCSQKQELITRLLFNLERLRFRV